MILTRIGATNFLGFRELDLSDPPRQGVIGILGAGESGRSAIGEAIAFALFGCPLSNSGSDPTAVIRDREEFAEVELCFELPGRGSYRVFREIGRQGDHLAQLEDLEAQRVVAGRERVAESLEELLRYSFADFRHGFFLAQGEVVRDASDLLVQSEDGRSRVAAVRGALARAEEREALAAAAARVAAAEARVAEAEVAFEEATSRVAARRAALGARAELCRHLDRLVAASRARGVAAELGGLACELRDRLSELPESRAALEAQATARRRLEERSRQLRAVLANFEQGIAARRDEIERGLVVGRRGSLFDARMGTCAEAARLEGRGRFHMGLGILVAGCGAVVGGLFGLRNLLVHLPPAIGRPLGGPALARDLPAEAPSGWGAALLIGLTLVLTGLWRRGRGRREAVAKRREIERLDRQIDALEGELSLLAGDDLATLVRRCQRGEVGGSRLRELAIQIATEHPDLLVPGLAGAGSQGALPGATDPVSESRAERAAAEAESFHREVVRLELRIEEVAARLESMGSRLKAAAEAGRPDVYGSAPAGGSRPLRPLVEAIDTGSRAALDRLAELEIVLEAGSAEPPALEVIEGPVAALRASLPSADRLADAMRADEEARAVVARSLEELRAELGARRSEYEGLAGASPGQLWGSARDELNLALRLAQTEVLLRARGLPEIHFLYLDEPLGRLDRRRSESLVHLLRELTSTFGQIFLATEDDGLRRSFDLAVELDPGAGALQIRGRGVPAERGAVGPSSVAI